MKFSWNETYKLHTNFAGNNEKYQYKITVNFSGLLRKIRRRPLTCLGPVYPTLMFGLYPQIVPPSSPLLLKYFSFNLSTIYKYYSY
jgi:hypothetical protein